MLRLSRRERKSATPPRGGILDSLTSPHDPGTMTGTFLHALALWATLMGVGGPGLHGDAPVGNVQDAATSAMQHVSEGTRLRRSGELLAACRHFRFAAGLTPTWPMARYELGRCLRLIGDPMGDAALHLEFARDGLPDRIGPLMELGRLAEDRQDKKRARHWYQAAVEADPKAKEPPLALARLGCIGAGMASFEHARRLVRADEHDPAARRALADASREAGFKEQAREAYGWLLNQARPSWRAIAAEARLDAPRAQGTKVSDRATRRRRVRRRR